MSGRHYDLIAVGGGSGGLAAAQRAAEYGARCAVIESHKLGGTCVNVGCVPKKVMWHAAGFPEAIRIAADYGFEASISPVGWDKLKEARDAYVLRLNGIYASNLEKRDVTLIREQAQFVGPRTIEAGGKTYTTDHVVIATGGHPTLPEIPGKELGITSDDFFELESRPQRVAVVGSGYIAMELSGMFRALGSDVSVFIRKDRVLRSFDPMLSEVLTERMESQGIEIFLCSELCELEMLDSGLSLTVDGGREAFDDFDAVLWAIGRSPNTSGLWLDAAGVDTDDAGFVPTDEYQNTNVEGVYAIGDVTGRAALTPVAIAAGRRLADRLFDGQTDRHLEYKDIPTVIFTHPPIGTVGMTEPEAREHYGDDVRVYTSRFVSLYYQLSEHRPQTSMKLVTVGEEERVVGCHIIGDGADEMLQGFAVAVRMGAKKDDFDDTVAIHPTSAEELVTMR